MNQGIAFLCRTFLNSYAKRSVSVKLFQKSWRKIKLPDSCDGETARRSVDETEVQHCEGCEASKRRKDDPARPPDALHFIPEIQTSERKQDQYGFVQIFHSKDFRHEIIEMIG